MKDNPYARLYRGKFPHGDRLDKIKRLIKWVMFRPVLNGLFKDTKVGRPNVDVVLMAKMLILQSWYSLSDEQLERECNNGLNFQNFLGYLTACLMLGRSGSSGRGWPPPERTGSSEKF